MVTLILINTDMISAHFQSSRFSMYTNNMLEGDISSNRLSNKELLQDPQYQQKRMVLSWREWENTEKKSCAITSSCTFPKNILIILTCWEVEI